MLDFFVHDIIAELEELGYENIVMCQDDVKKHISPDNFPMICYEHTEDSDFEVNMDESKFLNDDAHNGHWFMGEEFALCLIDYRTTLEIDVLEVNESMRGEGIGRKIVEAIENVAESYFDYMRISPFDTSAINFWEHMGYVEAKSGNWVKILH